MKVRIMCAIPVTELGREILFTCALPPEAGIPANGDGIEFWRGGKTIRVIATAVERRYAGDLATVVIRCSPIVFSTRAEAEDARTALPPDVRVWESGDVDHERVEGCVAATVKSFALGKLVRTVTLTRDNETTRTTET